MKTSIPILTAMLLAASFPSSALAQARKKEPAPAAAETKPAEAAKPAAKEAKAVKPLPMNARVDEIDASAKTFTQVRKDGVRVKHVLTQDTPIHQGEAAAKFEDLKVGDMVGGLRIKKNPDGTEYEVVKITKFGPKKTDETKPKKPN
jgi:hypothetical protein